MVEVVVQSVLERKLSILDLFKDRIVPEVMSLLQDVPGELAQKLERVQVFLA